MKIFTGEYIAGKIIGLKLEKKKNRYIFVEEKELFLEDFKEKNAYISIDLQDFIIQKVEIPPIRDKSAIEFIIKNKLSNQIEEDIENYRILFFKDEAQSIPTQFSFNVFLIKKDNINKSFPQNILENLNILTISSFSLAGLAKVLNSKNYILHFYGDEKRAILVLCKDGNIEYVRETYVPEFIFSQEDLRNFYYESLNLTYIYLKQNRNIKIDNILLSGLISEDESLVKDIYSFAGIPVFSLNYKQIIENMDIKIFNRNIIPIGNLFLDKKYDVREKEILFKRRFNIFSKYITLLLSLIFIFISGALFKNYFDLKVLENELNVEKQLFQQKAQTVIRDIKLSPEEIKYYVNYLKLYNEAFKFNFFDFLNEIKPLLFVHKFSNLSYKKLSDTQFSINLQSKITFNSLISLNEFNTELQNILENLKNKMEVRNNSKIDINKLTLDLDITLIKQVKR